MANKTKTPEEAVTPVAEPAAEAQTETEAQKYTIEKLREHCFGLFAVTSSTFDAATNGLTKPDSITVEEMREHLRTFLGTKLNTKGVK